MINYLKRVVWNVKYYRKKNILLVCIFFIVTVLFLITSAVRLAVQEKKEQIGTEYAIEITLQKEGAEWVSYSPDSYLEADYVAQLVGMPEVIDDSYLAEVNAKNPELEAAIPQIELEQKDDPNFYSSKLERDAGPFTLVGITDIEAHNNFKQGDEIVAGRGFTSLDAGKPYAVVSETFMDNNQFQIGDTFYLQCGFDATREVELEIIGVHSGNYEWGMAYVSEANYIYTPVENATALSGGVMRATYRIASVNEQAKFLQKVSSLAEQKAIKVDVYEDTHEYLIAVTPFKGIENVCNAILISVSIITTLLMCLLATYSTLERKQEIGILIAMGEAKGKLIIQLWLENLIPLLMGLAAGVVLWWVAANGFQQMLQKVVPYFQSITENMTLQGVITVFMVSVGMSVLATLVSIVGIMNYSLQSMLSEDE